MQSMKKKGKTYNYFQKLSSILLMLTLVWLTVSTPFIVACQQELAKQHKAMSADIGCTDNDDETGSSSVEEKASGSTLSEEFLHNFHCTHYFQSKSLAYHKLENADTYTAFHGELLVPPPNQA